MLDRRLFLGGTGAALISATGRLRAAGDGDQAAIRARIRKFLGPFVAAKDFSGIVAIQRATGPALIETFGAANFTRRTSINASTLFGIESISKLLTVQALRALKAQGRFVTTDPLAKYIPDFPNGHAITIAMLAQHTSGISRDLSPDVLDYSRPHGTSELVEIIKKTKPVGTPGSGSNYSNNGYIVLARVLELAGGASYPDLVRSLVLAPLGMSHTAEWSIGDHPVGLATPYQPGWGWGSIQTPAPRDMTNYRGAASFYSSAADLLKLAKSLPAEGPRLSDPKVWTHVGHDGRGHGYVSFAYNYPDQQTAIVVLGNIESGLFDSLRPSLEAIVFGNIAPKVEVPNSLAREGPIDADFLGKYDLFGSPLLLAKDTNGRYFVDAGDGQQPLISIGMNTLLSRLRYATLSREIADKQVVLAWSEPSGSFTLKRLS